MGLFLILTQEILWLTYKQIGNCVTLAKMKMFLSVLFVVPVTFIISISPIIGLVRRQLVDALEASRADPIIQRIWWTKTYSWAFAGPIGRHILGTVLGFRVLSERLGRNRLSDSLLEVPHVRLHLTIMLGFIVSVFSFVSEINQYVFEMLLTPKSRFSQLRPAGNY